MSGVQPIELLPDLLYKYLPPERIDILESMQIRFSRPSEFNDIFDSHFLVPRSQGGKAIANRFRWKVQLGVFCLAERPDNHLMWVDYASSHTGFVVGFDAHAPFFGADGRVLRKVEYRKKPKVALEVDMNACFDKSETWKHEEEWRCVRRFDHKEPREVAIEPSLIRQIIFGAKMEAWHKAKIMFVAKAYEMTKTMTFLLSQPSSPSWSIEIRPTNVAVCDKCDGDGYVMEDLKTPTKE